MGIHQEVQDRFNRETGGETDILIDHIERLEAEVAELRKFKEEFEGYFISLEQLWLQINDSGES